MDYFAYLLNLKKILFTEEERKNNIIISLVKNNLSQDSFISGIICVNLKSFENNQEDNLYYYVDLDNLQMLEKSDLENLFNAKKIEYIYEDDSKITGISENKKRIL